MLVKGGRTPVDAFATVADGIPLPSGPVIVSLKRFAAEKTALLARGVPLGVRLETGDSPESLGEDVHKLAVVVLHVPHFKDGRAYSWARLLRTRLHYTGEVRVSGHVLKDQLAFYARVGVDAFELPDNFPLAEIDAALHEISNVYQPSVDGRTTILDLRRGHASKTARAP
jgi:uncharacterized protein (DUF934 family)